MGAVEINWGLSERTKANKVWGDIPVEPPDLANSEKHCERLQAIHIESKVLLRRSEQMGSQRIRKRYKFQKCQRITDSVTSLRGKFIQESGSDRLPQIRQYLSGRPTLSNGNAFGF